MDRSERSGWLAAILVTLWDIANNERAKGEVRVKALSAAAEIVMHAIDPIDLDAPVIPVIYDDID